ncbi:response regulator [Paenibacillus turpanensis]|uniref:response regulator n=1 Tax=Paenibacillus turpanensis TaxID=2689078 RepID=UPI001408A71E|nr:response regulator [Paenibacillus turpanensis]
MRREPYKVILVDDEPIILRSLKAAIPWQELNLSICGEARNGEQALQLVLEEAPHIVISDIRMPVIDGISLMKEVMARHPKLVFIFISGYGEFEYAREALRQGAFDYMLKPIDHEELTDMIERAVAKLDEERHARLENERLLHSVETLSMLAQERMFAELIEGNPRPLTRLTWLENSELEKDYFMAVAQLDQYSAMNRQWTADEKRLWFFAVRNILEEWSAQNGGLTVFPFHSGEWILLFPAKGVAEKRRLGEDIVHHIKTYTKLSCSVGLSCDGRGMEQLSDSYQSAARALYQRFRFGREGVYLDAEPDGSGGAIERSVVSGKLSGGAEARVETAGGQGGSAEWDRGGSGSRQGESAEDNRQPSIPYPKQLEEQMLDCIRALYIPGLRRRFDELKEELIRLEVTREIAERLILELVVILNRQMEHVHSSVQGTVESVMHRLQDSGTLEEMIEVVKSEIAGWMESAKEATAKEDCRSVVDKAKKYIAAHYHKDLGIDEVAESAGLSTSHFCTLFKQASGYTFLEYLTQCRIEKAKYILANTDVRVYQVAPLVGYQDPRYFTQVFKKLTGLTPSEYRESQTAV